VRDNGRDTDVLKYLSCESKTNKEIYLHYNGKQFDKNGKKIEYIMRNTLYSMLKRFVKKKQVAKIIDPTAKGGNGQALLRYKTLDIPLVQLPKAPGFLTKSWGRLPSRHSMAMASI